MFYKLFLTNLNLITKYTLGVMLLSVALLQKFPLIKVGGTFVSIRIEDFILLFAGSLVALYFFKNPKSFLHNGVYRLYFLYLLISLISLINGIYVIKTVSPNLGLLHFLRRIEYFIPFILAYELTKHKENNINYFYKILFVIIAVVFFYGIGQKYFGVPIIVTQNQEYSQGVALKYIEGSHLNSTFAGHYDLASFLVLTLPIFIVSFFLFKNKISKIFVLFIFIMGMWLLVNSASRISFVSLLIAEAVALYIAEKRKMIFPVLGISILFIGISSNLLDRYSRFFNVYIERLKNVISLDLNTVYAATSDHEDELFKRSKVSPTPTPIPVFEDRSTSIRLNVEWPRAIRSFYKNPLLGTGFSSIDLATDNDYLRMLGETGLLGLYTFGLFWINIFIIVSKNIKKLKTMSIIGVSMICGFTGAMPGILINAMFIDVFEASKFAIIFWFVSGIVVSLLYNIIPKKRFLYDQ